MDQLELLKSKWKSQASDYPAYSKVQLTGLLAKKSSSIVKWIFYIGVAEFLLLAIVTIFYTGGNHDMDQMIQILGEPFYYGSIAISYVAILFFIYRFWINYKNISSDQPTRTLMKNILKTRRTMKWYIWYNMGYGMIFGVIAFIIILLNDPQFAEIINSSEFQEHKFRFIIGWAGFILLILSVFCAVVYGIYSLIYGILLRRLKNNYQELKKMEV